MLKLLALFARKEAFHNNAKSIYKGNPDFAIAKTVMNAHTMLIMSYEAWRLISLYDD